MQPRLYTLLFVFLIITLVAPFSVCPDERIIAFAGTETVRNSWYGEWLTMIFTEAFRRLGYGFRCDGYPGARATYLSDSGMVDGEISRVFEYQSSNSNLIRLEEILYSTRFTAFAVKPGISLAGWDSLANTAYIVEYRQGVSLCEQELSRVVPPGNLSSVSNAEMGIKKLLLGRTDLFIDLDFTTMDVLASLDRKQYDPSRVYEAGVMQEIDAYAYMHKKRAELVPMIEQILRNMKKEGLFEYYRDIILNTR